MYGRQVSNLSSVADYAITPGGIGVCDLRPIMPVCASNTVHKDPVLYKQVIFN